MNEIRDPSREEFTEASADPSFGSDSDENAGRHAHVLLIEDDSAICGMIENYLTQHGMDVVSAADRNSATRHLSEEPSLIILDLQLGKDDGLDLACDQVALGCADHHNNRSSPR
jgi:PleD family two-component response regulator